MKWFHKSVPQRLVVDIHSHLIPGIDDGAATLSDSIQMILHFKDLGFQKLVTTPHIHPNYPNTRERILEGLSIVRKELAQRHIEMEIEAAAEYFVDDVFIQKLDNGKPLLSFGDKYVLIECSFLVKPFFFESVIYKLKSQGYKPVFAHPERYKFLEDNIEWLKELKRSGILFQVTLGSLGGYYGKVPKQIAMRLIKDNLVDFLASDLHRTSQVEYLKMGLEMKEVQNALKTGKVLNNSLR